jgi:hypothetical protein
MKNLLVQTTENVCSGDKCVFSYRVFYSYFAYVSLYIPCVNDYQTYSLAEV